MIAGTKIRRVHYGFIVAPSGSPDAGQPIPVCGYLVDHPDGLLLFDTGLAPVDDETRRRYHPRAMSVETALRVIGLRTSDVSLIVNCHLHADHAGGNAAFPGVPVFVQQSELNAARRPDYTVAEHTHAFDGARLSILDGEAELLPGVRVIQTPGHSPGHQALAVDTDKGWLVLAGQAFNSASEFGFAAFSHRLAGSGLGLIGVTPTWMKDITALDPIGIYFAHDLAVFDRDQSDLGRPLPI